MHKLILSVDDVVQLTAFSRRTVIRWFEKEPGVIVVERPETLHKRRYRTLMIPRKVYERVMGSGRKGARSNQHQLGHFQAQEAGLIIEPRG